MTKKASVLLSLLVISLLVACSSSSPDSDAPVSAEVFARELSAAVGIDGIWTHLRELQDIADANAGNRAEGTAGFDASVDYVAQILRDNGFDVQTPEFTRLKITTQGDQKLIVGGRTYPVDQASLLLTTPVGGLDAITLRPSKPSGCSPSDYGTVKVKGAIVVVDDTSCSVVDKQNAAVTKGAVGVLVASKPGRNGSPEGLFTRGYYQQLTVPVGVIESDADAALRRTGASVELTLASKGVQVTSRNVLAQTKSGDTHNVVMAGAHLDSVPAGPGINDNGSGVAAVLETALQLGSAPSVTNAVRFAFWASEEPGLNGSVDYVFGLDRDQLNDIALYLNVDLIGSLNAGFFTYDGDQSGAPNPDLDASQIPSGSAGIERTLAGYLNLAGKRPADVPLGATTDYHPFLRAGVPIGGMTTGSSQKKTAVQARLWGGKPGVAFDPNYHSARDTIDNVDRDTLAIMAPGLAFAVGTYAQSVEGVNGVPLPALRHRAAMGP